MLRRSSILLASLIVVPLLAGCSGSDDASSPSTAPPTPLAELDVGSVRLARAEFCDRVQDAAVRRALDGDVESDDSWGNGDPVPGTDGTGDVAHEIGCAWTGAAGTSARAWVFARPVDAAFARGLRPDAATKTCGATSTSEFGDAAYLQTCVLPGALTRVRRAGLFGDTWLTCELTGGESQKAAVRARLDPWCAAVVAALDVATD